MEIIYSTYTVRETIMLEVEISKYPQLHMWYRNGKIGFSTVLSEREVVRHKANRVKKWRQSGALKIIFSGSADGLWHYKRVRHKIQWTRKKYRRTVRRSHHRAFCKLPLAFSCEAFCDLHWIQWTRKLDYLEPCIFVCICICFWIIHFVVCICVSRYSTKWSRHVWFRIIQFRTSSL